MIRFIHTGDIHLGLKFNNVSFDREKAMERRRELWSTFKRIVDYGNENSDFLFIAGDLFEDEYFTIRDIERVRDIFKSANSIEIIISAGNHDFKGRKSLYNRIEWPENVTIFGDNMDKKEFPEKNTVIYGYSWDNSIMVENNLFKGFKKDMDLNKNNILVLHGDISSNTDYLPLNLKELEGLNMDYIALGHIHKPEIIRDNIAYCGCPEPLDFGETGDRGIIQGFIENKKTTIKFLPFSQRRFLEIDINLNENMGYYEIINAINDINIGNKSKDFYRIKLQGFIQRNIHIREIEKDLKAGYYYIEIIDNTSWEYDLEELELNNKDNIISFFIREMKEKDLDNPLVKRALYLGLDELLKGG